MQAQDVVARFADVDGSRYTEPFIRFVDDANALESVRVCKNRMMRLLEPRAGGRFLDVGCGAGDDVRALAHVVGGGGSVAGIDGSAAMIAEARRRGANGGAAIDFQVGDAHRLDFLDDSFDGCRAERVLMHVSDPGRVIAEMARVAFPGGRVVAFDFDWDAVVIDHPDRVLTRELVLWLSDSLPSGSIGRRLCALFRAVGLEEVRVCPHTIADAPYEFFVRVLGNSPDRARQAGVLLEAEVSGWWRDLEEAHLAGRFFAGFPGFIVSGRKRGGPSGLASRPAGQ